MGKKGGKQPGAGRPKGSKASHTLEASKARQYVIERVVSEMEPILTAQIDSAKGLWMEELDSDGVRKRIYRKAPDTRAVEYLVDQTIGRASQAIDVTSKGESVSVASPEAVALAREYERKLKETL